MRERDGGGGRREREGEREKVLAKSQFYTKYLKFHEFYINCSYIRQAHDTHSFMCNPKTSIKW
jgi:hypothetical protein